MAASATFSCLANGVRREHGIEDFVRSDYASFVMDGLLGSARFSSRNHQLLLAGLSQTDVLKRGRQADVLTERENSFRFLHGCVCQLEPGQNAKGDLFAVVE